MHSGGCGLRLALQPAHSQFPDRRAQPGTSQEDSQRHPQSEGCPTALRLDLTVKRYSLKRDVYLLVQHWWIVWIQGWSWIMLWFESFGLEWRNMNFILKSNVFRSGLIPSCWGQEWPAFTKIGVFLGGIKETKGVCGLLFIYSISRASLRSQQLMALLVPLLYFKWV